MADPAYIIIKNALSWYDRRDDCAYWYGAKRQVLTDDLMDYYVSAYPDHFKRYSADDLERLKRWSRGKIGFDCSGFVSACVGVNGWSSASLWARTVNRSDVREAKAGCLLYRPGHIGIDIGYGYSLDIPIEGQTIRLTRNTIPGFTYGGEWYDADYEMMNNY